jgi:hypothetical protein
MVGEPVADAEDGLVVCRRRQLISTYHKVVSGARFQLVVDEAKAIMPCHE